MIGNLSLSRAARGRPDHLGLVRRSVRLWRRLCQRRGSREVGPAARLRRRRRRPSGPGTAAAGLATLLALTAPALAGPDEYTCALWAQSQTTFDFLTSTDVDFLTADEGFILLRLSDRFNDCLARAEAHPAVKAGDAKSATDVYLAALHAMLQARFAQVGTLPAGDDPTPATRGLSCDPGPCLTPGSDEWKAYCRENWPRTYRSADDTVVRPGSGGRRIPCPA